MQPDRFDVRRETQGRWRGILAHVGLTQKQLSGKRVECPICRNGAKSDSFRFDDKDGRGTFYCNHCGAGDGISLVMKVRGVDFKEAVEMIKPVVSTAPIVQPKAAKDSAPEEKEKMAALWARAKPLDGNDLASRYLMRRGIVMDAWPPSLRFVDDLPYGEEKTRRFLPALLAKFVAPDQKSAILHRTWLSEPGAKADVEFPRKMWRGSIPDGGAVRLGPIAETMGVAEGLETALSASLIHNVPVWACTSAGALVKFAPPPECKNLIVFGDNDASFTGQMAAYSLAYRLSMVPKDRRIRAQVHLPAYWDTGEKVDWNDLRMAEAERAA